MKKNSKIMRFASLGIIMSMLAIVGVGASSADFISYVPSYQGKAYTPSRYKETGNDTLATVVVDNMGNEAVTFKVGPSDHSDYGQGVVVKQSKMGITHYLNYNHIYGIGQSVNAQYYNHNWTSHSGFISGTVNYY